MNEALSTKDAKKLNKASALSYSSNPKDQDRARARQVDVDYKDLLRQINSRKKPNKPAVSKMKESFTIDKSAHKKAQKKSKMRNLAKGNTNPNEKAAAEKKAGGPKLYGEAKERHPRDQKELDRAQAYIKKNPNFGKKNVKEEDIPRGPGGKPIRIKDKIRAAKGQITHSEGKTFDAWKKAAASALGRKKEERKAQPATDAGARARRKLKDKEQKKYVNFLPAEDD